jgi:hypothetical protein
LWEESVEEKTEAGVGVAEDRRFEEGREGEEEVVCHFGEEDEEEGVDSVEVCCCSAS